MALHPLDDLSVDEMNLARKVVLEAHGEAVLVFREIYLAEPPKAQLLPYLDAENDGSLTPDAPRPARQARCQYDVVSKSRIPAFYEAVIDLESKSIVESEIVDKKYYAALIM
jgi:primary-amine oxidase